MLDIIIDDRERAIIDMMVVPHTKKRLKCGDYHIYNNNELKLIIERKTLHDLSASIKDKRVYNQIKAMRETKIPFAFIIEGGFDDYWMQNRYNKHLLPITSLKTRLRHMTEEGIPIIYTKNKTETVNLFEADIEKVTTKILNMI
jgi:ERCC4-type nuclease